MVAPIVPHPCRPHAVPAAVRAALGTLPHHDSRHGLPDTAGSRGAGDRQVDGLAVSLLLNVLRLVSSADRAAPVRSKAVA